MVAPIGTTSIAQVARIKSRHLTWSTHGTPTLPAKFAEEDVAPHLHEDECWSATRGASGDDVSTRKAHKPQEARSGRIGRAPPFRLTRTYLSYRSSPSESTLLSSRGHRVGPRWRSPCEHPSRSLALRPTLPYSTALSSKSEQQVSGPSR